MAEVEEPQPELEEFDEPEPNAASAKKPKPLEYFDEPSPTLDRVIHKAGSHKLEDSDVRFFLSIGLLIIIGILAIGGELAWVFYKVDLKELLIILSPITAIAGSVFTFYFAEEKKKKGRR